MADWNVSPRQQRSPTTAVPEALTPPYLRPSDPTAHLISPGAAAHQAQALHQLQQSLQAKRQALQRDAHLTPAADLKTRLANRMQQLEHQSRQTPAQYAAMTAASQTRHVLGGMRRQWSTDEALRQRRTEVQLADSIAGGRPNVTQIDVDLNSINAGQVLRSRIATNAAGVSEILRHSSQKRHSPGSRTRQGASIQSMTDQETAVMATIARGRAVANAERRRPKTGLVVHPRHQQASV